MDRRVKERLIGATILVALIVLIVPEMLSGPKRPVLPPRAASLPAPTRHVSVDLATSRATPAPQPADSAIASSAEPPGGATPGGAASESPAARDESPARADAVPGAATPSAPPMVTTLRAQGASAPALETERSSPTSAPETAKSAVDNAGSLQAQSAWSVQLGSFASKANADKLVHQLKAGGSPVYVISSGAGPSLRYRVRIGPLPDRGAAERAVLKLKAAGHAATIVNPAS